jgi:hypothetical protein
LNLWNSRPYCDSELLERNEAVSIRFLFIGGVEPIVAFVWTAPYWWYWDSTWNNATWSFSWDGNDVGRQGSSQRDDVCELPEASSILVQGE